MKQTFFHTAKSFIPGEKVRIVASSKIFSDVKYLQKREFEKKLQFVEAQRDTTLITISFRAGLKARGLGEGARSFGHESTERLKFEIQSHANFSDEGRHLRLTGEQDRGFVA